MSKRIIPIGKAPRLHIRRRRCSFKFPRSKEGNDGRRGPDNGNTDRRPQETSSTQIFHADSSLIGFADKPCRSYILGS